MEVGLGPGDIVLDGDLAPPPDGKGHISPPPLFGSLLWPASPQARNLPITRIVDWTVCGGRLSWQSYRIIATRLVSFLNSPFPLQWEGVLAVTDVQRIVCIHQSSVVGW